jgi:signal transduction histidine kinase
MGKLAGSVAHELRNPLAVIMNSVYYLTMSLEGADEKLHEYLKYIEEETRSANKIITELLDFARETEQCRERVSLPTLVKQVLSKQPAPEGVTCKLNFPIDLPDLMVDPDHIKQVLANLISNAYHAILEGGQVQISAYPQPLAGSRGVTVEVADTGVGIPPENLQKIFQPLFTTRSRGIGLGLTVSKKLVEANHGEINVTSEKGRGSCFQVTLPAAPMDSGEGSSAEGG